MPCRKTEWCNEDRYLEINKFLDKYFQPVVVYEDSGKTGPSDIYDYDRTMLLIAGPLEDDFPIEISAGFGRYDSKKREWIFDDLLVDSNNNNGANWEITHYADNCDFVSELLPIFHQLYCLNKDRE